MLRLPFFLRQPTHNTWDDTPLKYVHTCAAFCKCLVDALYNVHSRGISRDADSRGIRSEFGEFAANSFGLRIRCEIAIKFTGLRIRCEFGLRIRRKSRRRRLCCIGDFMYPRPPTFPLPFARSLCFPLPLAACSLLSCLPLSPSIEPPLPLSYPSRTLSTVPVVAAFFSLTPALYCSWLSASLAPTLLPSLPLAGAPRPCLGALPSLPFPSLRSATGLAAVPPFCLLLPTLALRPSPPSPHLPPVDGVWPRLRGLAATALALHVRQRLVPRRLLAVRLSLHLRPHRRADLWGRPRRLLLEPVFGLRPLLPLPAPLSPFPFLVPCRIPGP